ncbi:MAG: polysaccharide deacetylase family protein [Gemmatimonadota bacterium]|nr:polysaccharide deacetylase family protein [Gemmatimonadota bacterium]
MMSLRAILTYHSLDDSGSPISVRPSAFEGHVRWLATSQVRVLPLEELWAEVHSGVDSHGDAVAITFDDGFANFAEQAAPLLHDLGLPSTVFVVSRRVGKTNAWRDRDEPGIPTLPLLDWDALGRLGESGVTVGGHTRTHRALDQLGTAEIIDEIIGGRDDISARLGLTPRSFAYPYGALADAASECVSRAYKLGVTTELRPLGRKDAASRLPRLDAYYLRGANDLRSWGSARFRWYLRLRAAIRSVRSA